MATARRSPTKSSGWTLGCERYPSDLLRGFIILGEGGKDILYWMRQQEAEGKPIPLIREMRSDMAVAKEVLVNRLYASVHRIFKATEEDKVLDLGGNTGLASVLLFAFSS